MSRFAPSSSLDAERLISDLKSARLSRRGFVSGAAGLGIAAPLAGAMYAAGLQNAGAVLLQDDGKTLVIAIAQSTVQLDPAIAGSNGYGDIIPIHDNLTEGLTRFKPGSIEIEGALAESWIASDDLLSYVFTLRPGVTFHDGTPVDAAAIETNVLRQLDPEHPLHTDNMVYTGILYADVESVAVTGDMEITFTMSAPTTLLPGNLAIFAGGIVSPTALESLGADFGQQVVGSGPYVFESFTRDVELVLVANESYWGGRPALDRIVFRTISDDTVRFTELSTGGIDVANQIDFKDVDRLEGDSNLQAISGNFLNMQYIGFNMSLAPFDNLAVRQAVQHAINKQNISDAIFYGNYTLGAGPVAPGLPGYDETLAEIYPYDPDRAKQLLTDAGIDGLEVELRNRANSFWPLIGQLIQADLAEIGITVNLQALEDAEFYSGLNDNSTAFFVNDWTWDNGDPDNVMFSLFSAPAAFDRFGFKDPEVDALNAQAKAETDQNVRADLYIQAQRLVLENSVQVVLGYPARIIGAQAGIQGLAISPIGSIPLRTVAIGE